VDSSKKTQSPNNILTQKQNDLLRVDI